MTSYYRPRVCMLPIRTHLLLEAHQRIISCRPDHIIALYLMVSQKSRFCVGSRRNHGQSMCAVIKARSDHRLEWRWLSFQNHRSIFGYHRYTFMTKNAIERICLLYNLHLKKTIALLIFFILLPLTQASDLILISPNLQHFNDRVCSSGLFPCWFG